MLAGRPLAERLKGLPQRNFVVRTGAERWRQAVAPDVHDSRFSYTDLLKRVRAQFTRPREEVEQEIEGRHAAIHRKTDEVLHATSEKSSE